MLPKLENSNNITAIEEEIQILKNLLNALFVRILHATSFLSFIMVLKNVLSLFTSLISNTSTSF